MNDNNTRLSRNAVIEYQNLERRFMKEYGNVHLCGNCVYTFTCKRMKIQNIRNIQRQKNLMTKLPFVKLFKVEPLLETQVPYGHGINFVSVFDCERFEFDKGAN